MSLLLEIRQKLDAAGAKISELEQAMLDYPNHAAIAANLESAVRIRQKLEGQFMEAAARTGVEVCRYRAFDDHDRAQAAPAFTAIAGFQRFVSVVFGAKKNGRKEKATVTEEESAQSTFNFGFAFTGSVGVVLTIPRDKPMLAESELDDAMKIVFSMARAKSPGEIQKYASDLGPGPITALYQWAKENVTHGLGAEVEWMHGDTVSERLMLQRQELTRLTNAIDETSSSKDDYIEIIGDLRMADVDGRRFRLAQSKDLRIFKGTVEPGAIDQRHRVQLPKKYKARIRRTTTNHLATGVKEVRYHLMWVAEVDKK